MNKSVIVWNSSEGHRLIYQDRQSNWHDIVYRVRHNGTRDDGRWEERYYDDLDWFLVTEATVGMV